MARPLQSFMQRDFSGGMNSNDHASSLKDNEYSFGVNIRIGERGALVKRPGSASLITETSTATIRAILSYFSTSSDEHLLRNENKIWKEFTGTAFVTAFTTALSRIAKAINYNGPIETVLTSGAVTEAAINTVKLASAGWTTNYYQDKIIKITTGQALNENKVIASNTKEELTVYGKWDVNPLATNAFKIYDVAPQALVYNGSDTPFKIKALSAHTSTRTDLGTIPNLEFAIIWNSRVWGFTRNSYKLRFSDVNNFQSWPINNYIDIEKGDGQILKALAITSIGLAVYKEQKTGIIVGDSVDNYAYKTRDSEHGCLAPDTACAWNGITFSLDRSGVYAFNGAQNVLISRQVNNQLDMTLALMTNAKAFIEGDLLFLSFPYDSTATYNNRQLAYDLKFKCWPGVDNQGFDFYLQYDNKTHGIKGSGVKVLRLENGTFNDDGATISMRADTKEWDLGHLAIQKKNKDLFVEAEAISTATYLTIKSEVDNEGFTIAGQMELGVAGTLWDQAEWDADSWSGADNVIEKFRIGEKGRNVKFQFTNNSVNKIELYKYELTYRPKNIK